MSASPLPKEIAEGQSLNIDYAQTVLMRTTVLWSLLFSRMQCSTVGEGEHAEYFGRMSCHFIALLAA